MLLAILWIELAQLALCSTVKFNPPSHSASSHPQGLLMPGDHALGIAALSSGYLTP